MHAWQEAGPNSDVCDMEESKEEPKDALAPPSVSSQCSLSRCNPCSEDGTSKLQTSLDGQDMILCLDVLQ